MREDSVAFTISCHPWEDTITLEGAPTKEHSSGNTNDDMARSYKIVVAVTTMIVIVAWVNVSNINSRNTRDFIGLEYFQYTENQ